MRFTEDCRDSSPGLLILEWESKGAQLIGDHADRPHILLRDVWLCKYCIKNLRGQILHCTFDRPCACCYAGIIWIHILGETEITEMEVNSPVLISSNEEIVRLQISMLDIT
jgi:hypothetical protein